MGRSDQVFLGAAFTNTDTDPSGLTVGHVVELDLSKDRSVRKTSSSHATTVLGVVIDGGSANSTVVVGSIPNQVLRVKVDASEAANRGDLLVSSATAGFATVDNAASVSQIFATVVANKIAGVGTFVEAILTTQGVGTVITTGGVSPTRVINADAGLTGTGNLSADLHLAVGQNVDGSILVNADDIQVGVLATDGQHGNRSGGALHALATNSSPGFMSASDFNKLVSQVEPVANISNLSSLNVTNLTTSTLRYVLSIKALFYLDKSSTITADGISIITASGGIGRWIRTSQQHPFWTTVTAWYLDASNRSTTANDENDGQSPTTPLLTHGELERRLGSYVFPDNATAPTVWIMSDVPSGQPFNISFGSAFNNIEYKSDFTQHAIGTGTITSLVSPNKTFGSETWWQITDSSIPVSWTASGFIDKWIVFKDVSNNIVASGPIIKDLGSKTMRVGALSQVGITSNTADQWGSGIVAVGNTYTVYDFPTIHDQVNVSSSYTAISFFGLHVTGNFFSASSNNFVNTNACVFSSPGFYSRQATGSTTSCFFNGAPILITEGRVRNIAGSTFKNSRMGVEADGWGAANGDIIMQNSSLIVESSAECLFDCDIGFIDCDSTIDTIFDLKYNSKVLLRGGTFWGYNNVPAHNTIRIQSANCMLMYSFNKPPKISHSDLNPDIVIFRTDGGPDRNHSWADLPISYELENTGIIYGGMQSAPASNIHAGFSVPAKATTGTGILVDVTASTDSVFGRIGSGDLGFAQVTTNQISTAAVTDAKLSNTTVTAGTYGDSTHVPTVTVNPQGRITNVSSIALSVGTGSISGLAAIATSGSATDLITGTVPATRFPALTGDVISTVGTVATTIANSAVTLTKMANLAAQRLIGNDTGTGAPVALTVTGGVEFTGSGGVQRSAVIGDVSIPAGSITSTLNNTAVSANAYGDASHVATFIVNSQGRLTNASNAAIAVDATAVITGTLAGSRLPAFTGGDVTSSSGSVVLTLNSVAAPGTYGDASHIPVTTINAKGLVTNVTLTAIAISSSAVSGLAAIATSGSASDLITGTVPGSRIPAFSGDVNVSAGTTTTTLRDSAGASVMGRSAGTTGHPTDITSSTDGEVLRRASGVVGWGTVPGSSVTGLANIAFTGSATDLTSGTMATSRLPAFTGGDVTSSVGSAVLTIGNSTVTLAKMANFPAQHLLGNDAGAGAPVALTLGTGAHFSGGFNDIQFDYITGISGNATWRGSTTSGNSLTIDASFGSDGGPLLMRASRWSFDVVSPPTLTASTETVVWDHKARNAIWATGALSTQRETVFRAPTYGFVGASTLTTAATVSITGAPNAGTNATITNPLALLVESGNASVLSGRLGVGTASPTYALEVVGMTRHSGATGINANPDTEAFAYLQTQITGDRDRVHFRIGGAGTALPSTGSIVSYSDWDTGVSGTSSLATGSTIAALFTHRLRPQTFFATSATITDDAPATLVVDGPPSFTGGMTAPANPRAIRVKTGDVSVDSGAVRAFQFVADALFGNTTINPTTAVFGGSVQITSNLVINRDLSVVRDVIFTKGIGTWGHGGFASQPTVTGSRGGNAALASLLGTLATYGFIIDSSTP